MSLRLWVGWLINPGGSYAAEHCSSISEIHQRPDRSTESYLRDASFSADMIDSFFRAFYGRVSEREPALQVACLSLLSRCLVAERCSCQGHGGDSETIGAMLPEGTIELNQVVGGMGPEYISRFLATGDGLNDRSCGQCDLCAALSAVPAP